MENTRFGVNGSSLPGHLTLGESSRFLSLSFLIWKARRHNSCHLLFGHQMKHQKMYSKELWTLHSLCFMPGTYHLRWSFMLFSSHTMPFVTSHYQVGSLASCYISGIQKREKKRQRNQRSNYQQPLDHRKSKTVPEKHLLLFYWLCQSLWLCGSQQIVENSTRDGNTRPPDLPLEKSVCRSGSDS